MSYDQHCSDGHVKPHVERAAEALLDLLMERPITGGSVPGDPMKRWRPATVRAISLLYPELPIGSTNDSDHPMFTPYFNVCAAVAYLDELGLIRVERDGETICRLELLP